MGIAKLFGKLKEGNSRRKDLLKEADEQMRVQEILEERKKSSNERELEKRLKVKREEQIKEQLDILRKEERDDIAFNHNPLHTPNITNKVSWEVMKEKNMFSGKNNKCMFSGQPFIHKGDNKMFRSRMSMMKGGNSLIR